MVCNLLDVPRCNDCCCNVTPGCSEEPLCVAGIYLDVEGIRSVLTTCQVTDLGIPSVDIDQHGIPSNCEILNLVNLGLTVEIGSDKRRLTVDGVLNQVLDSPPSVILVKDVKIVLRDPFLGESHGLNKRHAH